MSELQLGNPFFNAHRSILKFGLVGGMTLFTLAGPSHAAEVYIDAEDVVPSKTRAFVSEFCVGCHNPEKLKGDLDLESLLDQSGLDSYEIWEDVEWMLSEREMPPAR